MGKKVFVTYGDKKYKNSRERIIRESIDLSFFDVSVLETEDIENDVEFREALKNRNFNLVFNQKNRGGGYWLWKPYVIYKQLKSLDTDDILIYSDAGCTIPTNDYTKSKLHEYVELVNRSRKGVLGFRNPHRESKWTKGDVFDYFGALHNETIFNTRQFTAGRIVARKCEHSLQIIKRWWEIAQQHPHYFDDTPSKTRNFDDFRENRHDQSVWSLICKTSGVEEDRAWNSIPIKATRIKN